MLIKIPILQVLRGLVYFFGLPTVLILVGGDAGWWQAWVYIGIFLLFTILSRMLIAKTHPDLIAERAGYDTNTDVKAWDRILSPLVGLWLPLVYLVTAGLDRRFNWSLPLPLWVFILSLLVLLAGSFISTWAIVENRFFSGVVRIQQERGHSVVDSGPYRFVRHPGYAGALLAAGAFPLFVNAIWAYIPVLVFIMTLVIRTGKEDATLLLELPGYQAYACQTKYRLIPGIW